MALEPLEGLRVVDLFAGSGALGIEALSRGAAWADFVERRGPTLATLRANLATLELEARATVWALELPRGLSTIGPALAAADLVLVDPPYGRGLAETCLRALGEEHGLAPGARVVVEHHSKDAMPEHAGRLARSRFRQYGETTVTTYVHPLA